MSALSYIRDYGDDDSLSEESDKEDKSYVKKAKLPTPNLSRVPIVSSEEHIDHPSLHNGCTRAFPHVRGNWATFTYIEYLNTENLSIIIEKLKTLITCLSETCILNEAPHISLSKTFVLRFHMIQSFTTSLQEALSDCDKFNLNFDSFEVYCNEERTRTFLALKVDASSNRYLNELTKKVDHILKEYRLPTFYEEPSYHMSLLSVTGDKQKVFLEILHNLNEILVEHNEQVLQPVNVTRVNCKTGNKIYQYYLK